MDYMIEIRCCVCKKRMGEIKGGQRPGMVSHGYCDVCLPKVKAEINEFLKNKKELHDE